MTAIVITPPTFEPVTLAEAKLQCRVDGTDEDALIAGYITAAREWCEKYDWRVYCTQTLQEWLDTWPDTRFIRLPNPPLQSVTKIEYYTEADNAAHEFAAADQWYITTAAQPGKVQLRADVSWPSDTLREAEAICVTYVAGWASAADVPQRIKQAIALIVGYWYENREDGLVGTVSREIDFSAKRLLGIDNARRF